MPDLPYNTSFWSSKGITSLLAQLLQNSCLFKSNLIIGMVILDEATQNREVNFTHPYSQFSKDKCISPQMFFLKNSYNSPISSC